MAYKRKFSKRRFKKSRRGRSTRRGPRTFKARVTQVLMKKVETKTYHFADENIQVNHNLGRNSGSLLIVKMATDAILFNIWADIPRGPASFQRIGDRITPRGMALKIYLAAKEDRPNTMIRIIIARVPKAINGVATLVDNVQPFETTLQLGNNGNKMLMNADKDRGIKFLYDRIHRFGSQGTSKTNGTGNPEKELTKIVKLWIKSKKSRDIIYDSTGSAQIVNNPLCMWIIPYEQYDTVVTDIIASYAYEGKLYYKDV